MMMMMIVPNAVVVAVAAEEAPLPRVEIAFPPSSFVVHREALFVVIIIIFTRDNEKSSEVFFVRLKRESLFGNRPIKSSSMSGKKWIKLRNFLKTHTNLVRLIYVRRHTHRKREREKQCRPRRPLRVRRRLCRAAAAAAFLLLRF